MPLLTIFSLAACSNKQDTKKETSNSQSTTKVTSKSANTSKSKDTSTDSEETSSSSLLTDAEISKAKTVGDFKKLFAKLMDQSVSITEEAGTSVTGSAKEQYDAMISTLKQGLENQKDCLLYTSGLQDCPQILDGRFPGPHEGSNRPGEPLLLQFSGAILG